eukprot:15467981-Alexandrium_andersonii.AAC.1
MHSGGARLLLMRPSASSLRCARLDDILLVKALPALGAATCPHRASRSRVRSPMSLRWFWLRAAGQDPSDP